MNRFLLIPVLLLTLLSAALGANVGGCNSIGGWLTGTCTDVTVPARATAALGDEPGTTSTSYVMAGYGSSATITPIATGNIFFMLTGSINNTTNADGCSLLLAYGTGSAPANGASAAGTTVGGAQVISGFNTGYLSWILQAHVTGLTPGTAYWFDAQFKAVTGGECVPNTGTATALEG